MRVVVVGLAATGATVVARALADGHEVVVLEDGPRSAGLVPRAARAVALGASVHLAPDVDFVQDAVAAADLVVPSPGVPPRHPATVAARALHVPVRSEIDLAAEALAARPEPPRLVAVTGTNGKTTVTTLLAAMGEAAGLRVVAAGNIGRPLLDVRDDDVDLVVAEVSSFQLELTTEAFAPDVAVLLNVAEDHLDWHGSADAYARAKANVFLHQGVDGVLVVNVDDPAARALAATAPGRVVAVSAGPPPRGGYGVVGGDIVGPTGVIAALGRDRAPHERVNAVAAAAAALAAGVETRGIADGLEGFVGLAHRMQLVATAAGVRYYDDSKATNPHATATALTGFEHVVLIAGGRNKALDLGVLRIHAPRVRAVVAIGEAADEVEAAFAGVASVTRAASMHDAVRAAARAAHAGDAVLLSPACASFDWYDGYAARGDDFAAEVTKLSEVRA